MWWAEPSQGLREQPRAAAGSRYRDTAPMPPAVSSPACPGHCRLPNLQPGTAESLRGGLWWWKEII